MSGIDRVYFSSGFSQEAAFNFSKAAEGVCSSIKKAFLSLGNCFSGLFRSEGWRNGYQNNRPGADRFKNLGPKTRVYCGRCGVTHPNNHKTDATSKKTSAVVKTENQRHTLKVSANLRANGIGSQHLSTVTR